MKKQIFLAMSAAYAELAANNLVTSGIQARWDQIAFAYACSQRWLGPGRLPTAEDMWGLRPHDYLVSCLEEAGPEELRGWLQTGYLSPESEVAAKARRKRLLADIEAGEVKGETPYWTYVRSKGFYPELAQALSPGCLWVSPAKDGEDRVIVSAVGESLDTTGTIAALCSEFAFPDGRWRRDGNRVTGMVPEKKMQPGRVRFLPHLKVNRKGAQVERYEISGYLVSQLYQFLVHVPESGELCQALAQEVGGLLEVLRIAQQTSGGDLLQVCKKLKINS